MKKLLFVAFIAIAGVAQATNYSEKINFEVNKDEKKEKKKVKSQKCYTYGMVAWCKPNEMLIDSVCYDTEVPGSYEQSKDCTRENGQLYAIFMCKTTSYLGSTITDY